MAFPAVVAAQTPGDVSGNGTVTLFDGQLIRDRFLKRTGPAGAAQLLSDANVDGSLDVADVVYVRGHPSPAVVSGNVIAVDFQSDFAVTSVDSDSLTLSLNGPEPGSLVVGAILAGTDHGGYLRRITQLALRWRTPPSRFRGWAIWTSRGSTWSSMASTMAIRPSCLVPAPGRFPWIQPRFTGWRLPACKDSEARRRIASAGTRLRWVPM